MPEAPDEIIVLTTVTDREAATVLGRGLVEERLAACVTALPGAFSFFRWESEAVGEEAEVLLFIKTHRAKLAELERYFQTAHPYDVPEFIVLQPEAVSAAYGDWMRSELHIARP
jgi:periplasmic divalent cation tolerance protein